MKKKLIIICLLLLTTGCSCQYNLNIHDNMIEENIVSTFSNDEIQESSNSKIMGDIEIDDQITPFIKNDQFPFVGNQNIKYDKKVSEDNGITTVSLKNNYSFNDYKRSKSYNCFENKDFSEKNGVYDLNLYGQFYCFYGNEVRINVKTDFKVFSNNADIVDDNTYTWIIDENNFKNKDISLQMKKSNLSYSNIKKVFFDSPIVIVIFIIAIFTLIGFLMVNYVRNKSIENNKI